MKFSIQEIVAQLDKEAASFHFPMLDNGYFYHGDQKLTVYRDSERWALSIEVLAYSKRNENLDGIITIASVFGNCILTKELNDNDNFFFLAADDGIPTFLQDDETSISFVNPKAEKIKVKDRDQLIPVVHDPRHYYSKGINLVYPDKILNYEFMRGLIPEYSSLFWVTREEIAGKIPLDLPELMTLIEWFHPDVADEEIPSKNETFQQIAAVITTGDISLYKPTKKPNTHWKNWPIGGTL